MFHRLCLTVTVLVFCLVAAELLLPLVPPHLGTMQRIVHHVDQSGNYYLRPDTAVEFAGMFETIDPPIVWQINDQGLRAAGHIGPPDRRLRIASYGDSETFGWSVALGDTFQQRMEAIDPSVEVLNLGIPGYNAENVADRMQATLPQYEPDLIVYLVNKNDVDLPNDISDSVLSSDLLLRLRFLWQVVLQKPRRQQLRISPERQAFLAAQLERIVRLAGEHRAALYLVFMKTATWEGALAQSRPGSLLASIGDGVDEVSGGDSAAPVVILAEPWLKPFARIDDHIPRQAHAVLAERLCERIAAAAGPGCRPPRWSPDGRAQPGSHLATAAPARVLAARGELAAAN